MSRFLVYLGVNFNWLEEAQVKILYKKQIYMLFLKQKTQSNTWRVKSNMYTFMCILVAKFIGPNDAMRHQRIGLSLFQVMPECHMFYITPVFESISKLMG